MKKKNGRPSAWNIHPGEILREEFLVPLGLTSYALARAIHVPVPRVHDIVLEKRGISSDTALRLSRFFGTSEQFWMNLQASFDLRRAKAEIGAKLNQIKPLRQNAA